MPSCMPVAVPSRIPPSLPALPSTSPQAITAALPQLSLWPTVLGVSHNLGWHLPIRAALPYLPCRVGSTVTYSGFKQRVAAMVAPGEGQVCACPAAGDPSVGILETG